MNYSLNFFLVRPDKDKNSKDVKTIYYYLTWGGLRLRKSTGEKCRQCDWIESDKKGKVQRVNGKLEYSTKVNVKLSDFENKIEKYFEPLVRVPVLEEVEALINGEEYVKDEFKGVFARFIKESEDGDRVTKKGKRIKVLTIKSYKQVQNIILEFEKKTGYDLNWKNINDKFYLKLTNYLFDELDYYDNGVGTVVKVLKTFLNWAVDEGIIKSRLYTSNWIKWEEQIDIVVLYPDELNLLFNLEAPTDRLQRTKDIFLAGCMTCLRVTNLLGVDKVDLTGNKLKVIAVKSDKPIHLEVPPLLMQIFKKYDNMLPEISQAQFNTALKDLAKWLGEYIRTNRKSLKQGFIGNDWGKKFIKTRYKRGEPIRVQKEMSEMITSHTMRRTGITSLLMMGLSEIEVKSISGHSISSEDFAKYVKIAEQFINKKSTEAWSKIASN